MAIESLTVQLDVPHGVDGGELLARIADRVTALAVQEAELMHGGSEESIIRSRQEQHTLMLERTYASCADPRLRPLQGEIMSIIREFSNATRKPVDLARRFAKAFPNVNVDWVSWVGDEMTIARVRHQMINFAKWGLRRYDWIGTPDDCIRCKALAAGGPYPVGAGPLPVLDSHAGCFCVLAGRFE